MEPPPPTHLPSLSQMTPNRKGKGKEKEKEKVKREWMMGSDVIQILPVPAPPSPASRRNSRGRNPTNTNNNNNRVSRLKDVQVNEVIVIDDEDEDHVAMDEDLIDVMILDEKIDVGKKGKGSVSNGNAFTPSKDIWNYHQSNPTENSAAKLNNSISIDDDYWSDGDNFSDADTHSPDFIDLTASVEAPIPWTSVGPNVEAPLPFFSAGPGAEESKPWFPVGPSAGAPIPWTSVGPNVEAPLPFFYASPGVEAAYTWFGPSAGAPWFAAGHAGDAVNGSYSLQMGEAQLAAHNSALQNIAEYKKSSAVGSSKPTNKLGSGNGVFGLDMSSKSSPSKTPNFSNKGANVVTGGSSFHGPGYKVQAGVPNGDGHFFFKPPMNITNISGAADLNIHGGSSHLNGAGGNLFSPNSHPYYYIPHHSGPFGPELSWDQSNSKSAMSLFTTPPIVHMPREVLPDPPTAVVSRTPRCVDRDDVLSKLQLFKRFDTVEDYSDHHYKGSSAHNAQKNWAKKIQDEWRILENDLPESIYVRAYETRMDLLRAVIVGADGTPYHDGLFFFDIHFPPLYPNVPPLVYYHSGGVRLNPNLYASGKVCLSLLGTWHSNANESWLPNRSTALQVLVSIQALILNQKPYFNEPGYEGTSGTPHGELRSEQYNESTFLLSLKTMTYTLRKPPKHFEDFVLGHFHKHAHDILVACRSYTDGARVGSLVKGGIRDVNEKNKSCSECLKTTLPVHVNILAQEFMQIGVEDCEKFCQVAKATTNSSAGGLPKKVAKPVKEVDESNSPLFKLVQL